MDPRNAAKNNPKIFNIGFHKTGTTSLTWFMREHGFRSLHSTALSMKYLDLGQQDDPFEDDGEIVDINALVTPQLLNRTVSQYDFFSDNPWPVLFRQLDECYPGSKFILTRRNVDNWAKSLLKYTREQRTRMRKMIYGYGNPEGHIKRYRQIYLKHNRHVLEHFSDKENLLVIDLEHDNDLITESLVDFLDIPSCRAVFPNANIGSE